MKLVPSTALAERAHAAVPVSTSLQWGLPWLRDRLPPPFPGQLIVLGAATNVGKTFLSLSMARGFAEQGRGPVVFYSLEDAPPEIGRRLDLGLSDPNLYVVFPPDGNLTRLLDDMEALDPVPSAILVDYLQLVGYDDATRRGVERGLVPAWGKADAVSRSTAALKACAKRLGVPLVLNSQLRRVPRDEARAFPTIDLLKESGDIENMSDVILLMGGRPRKETVTVEISKAKNAPVGERMKYARGPGGVLVPVEGTEI